MLIQADPYTKELEREIQSLNDRIKTLEDYILPKIEAEKQDYSEG